MFFGFGNQMHCEVLSDMPLAYEILQLHVCRIASEGCGNIVEFFFAGYSS